MLFKVQGDQKENLTQDELISHALNYENAVLTTSGALSVTTGKYTGRSPKDKYIVRDQFSSNIHWGEINQPVEYSVYEKLLRKVKNFLFNREHFEFQGYIGSHDEHGLRISVHSEYAWHALFSKNLLIDSSKPHKYESDFSVFVAPSVLATKEDGIHSEAFIMINLSEKTVIIGGTQYAGEIKKSLFSVMNYLLPMRNVLPMHCGANIGEQGDIALFFGLSGTGKTTLSSSPERFLIGDDEHGWSKDAVFNLEGGCYAKTIGLSEEKEPDIYRAIRTGAVLENVVLNEENEPVFEDSRLTENTRVAYPIDFINRISKPCVEGRPTTIFFLTADAFGVLPPISKLTNEQAMYYFLNGYTSKMAGTERGITEPTVTFSACFGAPFLPLHPNEYANLFYEKIEETYCDIYLVNTGWTSGGYKKSKRIELTYTRKLISDALSGDLNKVPYQKDEIFGLSFPTKANGVPSEILNPENGWDSKEEYREKATELKKLFDKNYNMLKKQWN